MCCAISPFLSCVFVDAVAVVVHLSSLSTLSQRMFAYHVQLYQLDYHPHWILHSWWTFVWHPRKIHRVIYTCRIISEKKKSSSVTVTFNRLILFQVIFHKFLFALIIAYSSVFCMCVNSRGVLEFLLDCTQVHWSFDDFFISWKLFGVNRQ